MTDYYQYLEPLYDGWRRIAYSAATWTIVSGGLAYLCAEYAAQGAFLLATLYAILTMVGIAGVWYNLKEGNLL